MDFGLKGKSVFVAAASKGLGKASALEFSREGAIVTIASRSLDELEKAAAEIRQETGNPVHVAAMDVNSLADIDAALAVAVNAGNGLDVLVTNAGGPAPGNFDNFDDAAWQKAFESNLLSVIRLIRGALPHMRDKGAGRIVNLTSSSIRQPISGLILSNTFRAGVYSLTKSLAIELAPQGILVNTVAPGRIATDRVAQLDENKAKNTGKSVEQIQAESIAQIPAGRYGIPSEFGKAVAFLGSFANGYITGQALLVDGGMVKAL
ncbi:SDR family oxidoreductase [Alicyclobacillus tolerans]|uniref:SDR family oxidoreductase n=1 Tax=Alicyclobacillus tolerans TaxID=90970 RepID=UPI001F3B1E10|nr:SDR family oxidoreductase [Alicyclobacillus tolerans]MCF8564313.1 SDR family oxidoreductase [Alicyclobacillus tolerans]